MQAEEGLHATENRKNQKDSENLTYANEESEWSKLKSSLRGSILQSRFFNQKTRKTKLLERSQMALDKWFLER